MTQPKEVLKQRALTAIRNNKLIFIWEVLCYIPMGHTSFYKTFPTDSQDYDEIVGELTKNKIEMKVSLRKKWYTSQNSNLQIMLMRIIAGDEERRNMSQKYLDIESGGEKLNTNIDLTKLSLNALEELRKLYENTNEKTH